MKTLKIDLANNVEDISIPACEYCNIPLIDTLDDGNYGVIRLFQHDDIFICLGDKCRDEFFEARLHEVSVDMS